MIPPASLSGASAASTRPRRRSCAASSASSPRGPARARSRGVSTRTVFPGTGKRVARINPSEEWIVAEVPELRILDDELWRAAKARQGEISKKYATSVAATRAAHANRLNSTHRPRYLLSGLLECGVCGGSYAKRGQDRYGCSNHVMSGSCAKAGTSTASRSRNGSWRG